MIKFILHFFCNFFQADPYHICDQVLLSVYKIDPRYSVSTMIVWRSHTLRTALDITSAVGGPWRRDS